VTYSFTQISQYLACPRRYRYRYQDGWQEKDSRAAMLFGRSFELALAAYFRREDAGVVFFKEWSAHRDTELEYSKRDTWASMLQQGFQLLDRFVQEDRVRIPRARRNLQVKFTRTLSNRNNFVAYVDGIGKLDGTQCLLEWKTTSCRYPEGPERLLALDPQLVCYSWMSGTAEVAEVVFVRKHLVEVQYLRTAISENQRQEFAALVENTIQQIESAHFLPTLESASPRTPA
jgi:hypothetical protein